MRRGEQAGRARGVRRVAGPVVGLLLALLLAAPTVLLTASPAQACRCAPSGVGQQARAADLVVAGTVLEVRDGVTRDPQDARAEQRRQGRQGQDGRQGRQGQDGRQGQQGQDGRQGQQGQDGQQGQQGQQGQDGRQGQQGQQDQQDQEDQDQGQQRQQRSRGDVTLVVGVDQVYEGEVPDATIDVTTALEPSVCGLGRLETDQRYFFFLDTEGAVLRATSCNGTTPADSGQADAIQAALGPGTPVEQAAPPVAVARTLVAEPGEPHPVLTAAPGGVLAAVGLIGLVVLGGVGSRR